VTVPLGARASGPPSRPVRFASAGPVSGTVSVPVSVPVPVSVSVSVSVSAPVWGGGVRAQGSGAEGGGERGAKGQMRGTTSMVTAKTTTLKRAPARGKSMKR